MFQYYIFVDETDPFRSGQVDERKFSDGLHAATPIGELDDERADEVRATTLGIHLRGGRGAPARASREYLHHLAGVGGRQHFGPFDENQASGTMLYTYTIHT